MEGLREQYAWAAGIFDGESNIRCNHQYHTTRKGEQRTYYRLAMKVAQTVYDDGVPDMITRLQDILGGRVSGPYNRNKEKHKPYYEWRVSNYIDFQRILCCIWPWLGKRKRRDAIAAMNEFYGNRPPMEWRKGNEQGRGSRPDRKNAPRDPATGRFV